VCIAKTQWRPHEYDWPFIIDHKFTISLRRAKGTPRRAVHWMSADVDRGGKGWDVS
jgi:hypothetical protein